MNNTITVLGCSAVGTVAETTSFLITHDRSRLLLDCGLNPGRQLLKLKIPPLEIAAIFISHCHADHLQGLPYFLFLRSVQERAKPGIPPIKLISHEAGIAAAKTITHSLYPDRNFNVDWVTLKPREEYSFGGMTLEPEFVEHTVPCFGLKITLASGQTVAFSGDTIPCDALLRLGKNATVLIQEAFGTVEDFGGLAASLKHATGKQAGEIAKACEPQRLITFHMQPPYLTEPKRSALLQEIKSIYDGDVTIPEELAEFRI